MKCISCSLEIDTKMKAAIQRNACPFCGSHIMDPKRASQYQSLHSVLNKTKFTNKDEVDLKIRDKVLEVLLENFEFIKLNSTPEEEELVAVDEDEDVTPDEDAISTSNVEDQAPTRSLAKAKAQAPTRQPTSKTSASIYHQAQRDIYEDIATDDSSEEELDDPDLKKYFQDTTPAEIREKVEARLQAARNVTSSGGIRRLR